MKTEPSKEALESAREWIKGLSWYLGAGADVSLAALLDAHFVAGEARGLERAAKYADPVDDALAGSIRALKPEGRR